jgi:predicted MFS family arabinose efflux permease
MPWNYFMKLTLPDTTRASIQQTFSALQYPNYRLWFTGQLVSLVGTWMQSTAQSYLVYELTKSPAYLGYVGFAAGLPTWLFTLYGGVIADRVSRRTMMLFTQTTMMILAFMLAGLVFTGVIQPWMIIVLAFLLGIANAFDAPARISFVAELVERKDLTNAIALNSTMFNSATVVGPAIAGMAYATLGPTWCFAINGLSFVAVIVALLLMHLQPIKVVQHRASAMSDIKEGFRFASNNRVIRILIIGQGALSMFGLSLMTLLPAWSTDVLNGDAKTYGLLLSGRGVGALIGALMIAAMGRYNNRGKLWTTGNLLMPVVMIGFALARWIPLSMAMIIITGWAFMVQVNTANAMVQMQVEDQLRGRVMSIYTLVFFGGMPIGALLAGSLANRVGEPITLMINATVLLLFAATIYLFLPFLRRQG